MTIRKNKWILNYILLLAGISASVSGIVMQIAYHFGNPDDITKANRIVLWLDYADWSVVHKIVIVIFVLSVVYHIYVHRKWYKAVLGKPYLCKKNRQVLLFSGLFILSTITGLIPWIIDVFGMSQFSRIIFIEIHDKISLILFVFILLHAIRRAKRFV